MNESDVEMTVPAETGETRAIHGSEAAPQIDPITSKAQLQDVITAIPSPTKVLFYLVDSMKLVLRVRVTRLQNDKIDIREKIKLEVFITEFI